MNIRLPRWTTGINEIDAWLEKVLSTIEQAINISFVPPLNVLQSGTAGTIVGVKTGTFILFGITVGSIAGGTYGSPTAGTVSLLDWDGSALVDSGVEQDCFLPFPNASGIGDGKLVAIVYFAGAWFIIAADCS